MIKDDDTFLARWLAGDLTEAELEAFRRDPQYEDYRRLAEAASQLRVQPPDAGALLNRIRERQGAKRHTFTRRWWIGAAAAVLLILAGYFAFLHAPPPVSLYTGIGQTLEHTLPDGSFVTLNANSRIVYPKRDFAGDRSVTLNGEAFFEVIPGDAFVVHTAEGRVEVLGTRFGVEARKGTLAVACQSGKVRVLDAGKTAVVLQGGERVAVVNGRILSKEAVEPQVIGAWKTGASKFYREPLSRVITALENQFGIHIQIDAAKARDTFTGSFLHRDLDTALEMVFRPMGLDYVQQGEKTYVVE